MGRRRIPVLHSLKDLGPRRVARRALPLLALVVLGGLVPRASANDVDRIREKALELEQKRVQHAYDTRVKVGEPNYLRVYKDFAFLYDQGKVDACRKEGADRLALYLVESWVNLDLADYEDDLKTHEMKGTVEYDGQQLNRLQLLARLASADDAAERRAIFTAVKPLIEHGNVFRNQIATRRVELYRERGFADYAAFYAEREGLDLDAVAARAEAFLAATGELHDELFTWAADVRLGEPTRKVRFPDLVYLAATRDQNAAFPPTDRHARVNELFAGLGLPGVNTKLPGFDDKPRTGRPIGFDSYPVVVPTDVRIGVTPVGTPLDYDNTISALSEAGLFLRSKQTRFEDAYLLNDAATATLGYLALGVRDHSGWLSAHTLLAGEELAAYHKHRAFRRLLDARMLAAQALYEIDLYRGAATAEDTFKERMKEATGIRLSSTDAKRALEFAVQMRSVSEFEGLLAASRLAAHFRATLGDDWYTGGKAGETFGAWYAAGGTLTLDTLTADLPGAADDFGPLVETVRAFAGLPAPSGE
jgi:hypothetical protein